MDKTFYIIDFFVVVAAIIVADTAQTLFHKWREKALDLGCDLCHKLGKLAKTPDKKYYLCAGCFDAYLAEHYPELDPNTLKRAFRRRRKRR